MIIQNNPKSWYGGTHCNTLRKVRLKIKTKDCQIRKIPFMRGTNI